MPIPPSIRTPARALFLHSHYRQRVPSRAVGVVLLAISLCGGVAAQTPPLLPPLTLQAALLEAEKRSQALQAQDAATRSARELAVAAGRLPDPILRLSVDNLPVDGPMRFSLTQDFMTMRSVGVTQTLTREDKRRARSTRFEREGDAAQAMRVMQLTALQRQTTLAWFDRHYQQQMVDLLTRQRDEAALQIEATETAYRAGRGSQADVFAARSAVARIDDRVREARDRHANAGISLARWVGDVASSPLGEVPRLTHTRMAEHLPQSGLDQIPDVALMESRAAVALAEAEVARQEKNSDWSVSFMYSQRGPAFSNMINVGVSVPLQWDQKNRQDREVSSRLALAEQMRAQREEAAREHGAALLATPLRDTIHRVANGAIAATPARQREELAWSVPAKRRLDELVDAPFLLGVREVEGLEDGTQVVLHGELREGAAALRHLGDAAAAKEFVARLAKEGRYQRDVY